VEQDCLFPADTQALLGRSDYSVTLHNCGEVGFSFRLLAVDMIRSVRLSLIHAPAKVSKQVKSSNRISQLSSAYTDSIPSNSPFLELVAVF